MFSALNNTIYSSSSSSFLNENENLQQFKNEKKSLKKSNWKIILQKNE
jgi:hypothetical protein